MRSLIIILLGLLLAVAMLAWARAPWRSRLFWIFSAAWLAVTGCNLSLGLSHGYTLAEELPIHLLILGVPVAFAFWLLHRRRA